MNLFDKNALLNQQILQQLYRINTIDRNSEWDIIWYLGGKNQVTLGEKAGKYYLLPPENLESSEVYTITSGLHLRNNLESTNKVTIDNRLINTLQDLSTVYPEIILR